MKEEERNQTIDGYTPFVQKKTYFFPPEPHIQIVLGRVPPPSGSTAFTDETYRLFVGSMSMPIRGSTGEKRDGEWKMDTSLTSKGSSFLSASETGSYCKSTTSSISGQSIRRQTSGTRTASWLVSFQNLLSDEEGIHGFREFMEKEFSEENINFYLAIQELRKLTIPDEIERRANTIYRHFLGPIALEPINVDSHARNQAESDLLGPTANAFLLAEDQIFKLMKEDTYPRFLKSPMFSSLVRREMEQEGNKTVIKKKGLKSWYKNSIKPRLSISVGSHQNRPGSNVRNIVHPIKLDLDSTSLTSPSSKGSGNSMSPRSLPDPIMEELSTPSLPPRAIPSPRPPPNPYILTPSRKYHEHSNLIRPAQSRKPNVSQSYVDMTHSHDEDGENSLLAQLGSNWTLIEEDEMDEFFTRLVSSNSKSSGHSSTGNQMYSSHPCLSSLSVLASPLITTSSPSADDIRSVRYRRRNHPPPPPPVPNKFKHPHPLPPPTRSTPLSSKYANVSSRSSLYV